jgi:hypothetical protein
MSIVKRKDSAGRNYFLNTTTGKRTTEASYKRSKTAKKTLSPHMARSGGKPSKSYCSVSGRALKVKQTSTAGRSLRKCR